MKHVGWFNELSFNDLTTTTQAFQYFLLRFLTFSFFWSAGIAFEMALANFCSLFGDPEYVRKVTFTLSRLRENPILEIHNPAALKYKQIIHRLVRATNSDTEGAPHWLRNTWIW